MINRREFLKAVGYGTAVLTLPGFKFNLSKKHTPNIGLQLYTIRKEIEKDFNGAIQKIAEIGYSGIETYSLPENVTLAHAAKFFKDLDLKVFSMHYELPVNEKLKSEVLKMVDAYGCDTLVYHGWPQDKSIKNLDPKTDIKRWPTIERYKNLDSLKRTVEVYNKAADGLKTEGIKLGLHNHWWEFEKTEDGIYPFYYLLKNLNPEILFEIDVYWAKTGGNDPIKIVRDFGKRAPFLHIKDGPAVKGNTTYHQVPIGDGTLDFKAIVKAGGENIKWMIVEFDEFAGNIFEALEKSYKYLTQNNLAKGKV